MPPIGVPLQCAGFSLSWLWPLSAADSLGVGRIVRVTTHAVGLRRLVAAVGVIGPEIRIDGAALQHEIDGGAVIGEEGIVVFAVPVLVPERDGAAAESPIRRSSNDPLDGVDKLVGALKQRLRVRQDFLTS